MALETTTVALADGSLLRDQAFIGGRWCDADDGWTFAVRNPATDELLATVPRMGIGETRRAIEAAPALAVGCTMVLKPAEQTPLSALAIAVLAERAGLPPGVLSIVTGDAEDAPAIGSEMTSNPIVRKIGFTGSNEVGKLLMHQCADQVKNVSLELGGNAPFIVFDDADLDEALAGAVLCKFRNSGQTCITANRILVQDGIHKEFVDR